MDLLKHLLLPQGGEYVSAQPAAPESAQHVTAVGQHAQYAHNPAFTLDPFALQRLFEHVASLAGTGASLPDQVLLTPQPLLHATEHPHAGKQQEGRSSRPWLRNTPQSLALPFPQPPVPTPARVSCPARTICAFWYHFGSCSNDLNNPNYKSNKVCKHLHYDEPGMEQVQVQNAPWHHKKACGLEKCLLRDGRRGGVGQEGGNGQEGNPSIGGERDQPVYVVPGLLNHAGQGGGITLSQASNQLVPLNKPKKRKNKKGKKRKTESLEVQRSMPVQAAPALTYANHQRTSAVKIKANEVCFFWYHGKCRRGETCPMLHELTQPPSFVQPPPDYIHHAPCNLDWCPGDQRHEDGRMYTKRVCAGPGIKGDVVREGGTEEYDTTSQPADPADPDDTEDEEWFLDGFPNA